MSDDQVPIGENPSESARGLPQFPDEGRSSAVPSSDVIRCPVCGAIAVQEKCKMICRSEVCRGRVILNCSEF